MPGSSSWMPYAPQGVKGFDDDDMRIPKIPSGQLPPLPCFLQKCNSNWIKMQNIPSSGADAV